MAEPRDVGAVRDFTSRKLDWLNAMASDPRVTDRDHRVACRVAEALNRDTGVAILSDAIILDDVPTVSDRWQLNDTRKRLERSGWWSVERGSGGRGSRYKVLEGNVQGFFDARIEKRDARNEKRVQRSGGNTEAKRTVVQTPHKHPLRGGESTTEKVATVPPVHLRTPSLDSQGKEDLVGLVTLSSDPIDWPDDVRVAQANFDERAGIIEYDGGYTRKEAEAMALRDLADEDVLTSHKGVNVPRQPSSSIGEIHFERRGRRERSAP